MGSLFAENRNGPTCDRVAQDGHENSRRVAHKREPTTVLAGITRSASVEELRSLLKPKVEEHARIARIFRSYGWEITLALTLIIEVVASVYQARWMPFARLQVKQGISKIDSAIASTLGVASTYEDQQFSESVPQSTSPAAPVRAEKASGGPLLEMTDPAQSRAAPKGLASAEYHLGLRYAAGAGVPQDESRAAEWFEKAANQGHPGAQRALSELYLRGEGVPKDVVRAYTWASIAMLAQSYPNPELKSIESQMTARQINDAERRIAAWSKSQATARR